MHGSAAVLFMPPCQCLGVKPMLTCHCTDILLYSSWIQNLCPQCLQNHQWMWMYMWQMRLICSSLSLQARDIKVLETEFNSEFVLRIIPKLDWDTLWNAADSVSYAIEWKFSHIILLHCSQYKTVLSMVIQKI